MANIGIITEEGVQAERETVSRSATLRADDDDGFQPSVIQEVSTDNKGEMSRIMTECGEAENRREGDNTEKVTVSGIITEDEIGSLKDLKNSEQFYIASDVYSGRVVVERLSITQSSDLLYYQESGGEKQLAFEFQLQLKQPE